MTRRDVKYAPPMLLLLVLNVSVSSAATPLGMKIGGLVKQTLVLNHEELLQLPLTDVRADLYCVGGSSSLASGVWTGVRLGLLLDMASVLPSAVKVALYAEDGFTSDLTLEVAQRENTIIAYKLNGEVLKKPDGTPSNRLVVPGRWGYKWVRDLTRIELVDYDFKGTYEREGYSDEAIIEGIMDGPSGSTVRPQITAWAPALGYLALFAVLAVAIPIGLKKRRSSRDRDEALLSGEDHGSNPPPTNACSSNNLK